MTKSLIGTVATLMVTDSIGSGNNFDLESMTIIPTTCCLYSGFCVTVRGYGN